LLRHSILCRILLTDVSSGKTIPAFSKHVTRQIALFFVLFLFFTPAHFAFGVWAVELARKEIQN
jgi:hypothetical protein